MKIKNVETKGERLKVVLTHRSKIIEIILIGYISLFNMKLFFDKNCRLSNKLKLVKKGSSFDRMTKNNVKTSPYTINLVEHKIQLIFKKDIKRIEIRVLDDGRIVDIQTELRIFPSFRQQQFLKSTIKSYRRRDLISETIKTAFVSIGIEDFETIYEIRKEKGWEYFLKYRGFGRKSLVQLKGLFKKYGYD